MTEVTPSNEQRRLLRIIGRMPLASAANLAAVLNVEPNVARQRLTALRNSGWIASVRRGMVERSQHRWFLTIEAVEWLYATDHEHLSPREIARAGGIARVLPAVEGRASTGQFASDHEHLPHLEEPYFAPFVEPDPSCDIPSGFHEHPPWTVTARGVQVCVRRLAMLEAVYRIAPGLMRRDQLTWPPDGVPIDADLHMTDFRLLRHGGFYHAVARYGEPLWVTFTYAGLHATERILRRKHAHRFWGIDAFVHGPDHYFRIANRVFYEDPEQAVEPSAQVIVAADAWAAELARRVLAHSTPTLICTADGRWSEPVEVVPSRDRISDPAGHPQIGRPQGVRQWSASNGGLGAINGPTAYRTLLTIAQFPAMRAAWLRELVRGSSQAFNDALDRFVEYELVARFDDRLYLAELGMRRAANLSRILTSVVRNRHGAYLEPDFRAHELRHNDGVNRLVVQFAREGAEAFGGWRAEINLPDITQVKPDLVILVDDGPFGAGAYCVEYERSATTPAEVHRKLGPYRKSAWHRRPLPLLVVSETERAARHFENTVSGLPILATDTATAARGPLTGDATVWTRDGATVPLHCQPIDGATAATLQPPASTRSTI